MCWGFFSEIGVDWSMDERDKITKMSYPYERVKERDMGNT